MYSDIVKRCIAWNEARYDQVYDYELARKLLTEESLELFEAKTPVEKLDAIGDIMFVGIGVFWKMGLTVEQIEGIFLINSDIEFDLTNMNMENIYDWCVQIQDWAFDAIDNNIPGVFPGVTLSSYSCFVLALGSLYGMGLQNRIYDVVRAICDSNDTKEVKGKTAANVKANVVKGAGFIPPTSALEIIYLEGLNYAKPDSQ